MTDPEPIPLNPQPKNGPPFRIASTSIPLDTWFNERLGWPRRTNKQLFTWKCPLGESGKPELREGVWVWVRV